MLVADGDSLIYMVTPSRYLSEPFIVDYEVNCHLLARAGGDFAALRGPADHLSSLAIRKSNAPTRPDR